MKSRKNKKDGYVSINIIFLFMFMCTLLIASAAILKDAGMYIDENIKTIREDYISDEAEKMLELNFYKAIETSLKKAECEKEFSKIMLSERGEAFEKAISLDYYNSEHTTAFLNKTVTEKNESSGMIRYIDLIIYVTYSDKDFQRGYIKKARLFNPYERYKDKDVKKLNSNEIKMLFMYEN